MSIRYRAIERYEMRFIPLTWRQKLLVVRGGAVEVALIAMIVVPAAVLLNPVFMLTGIAMAIFQFRRT